MSESIFISYCSADKATAQMIDTDMQSFGFNVTIDERGLKPKQSVRDFMDSINQRDYAITIISDSYLRSYYCMYEIGSLMKEDKYKEKTLQIILPDAKDIFDKNKKYKYFNFWDKKIKELESLAKSHTSADNLKVVVEDLKDAKQIKEDLPEFIDFLTKEKAFTLDSIKDDKYQSLLDYIKSKEQNKLASQDVEKEKTEDIQNKEKTNIKKNIVDILFEKEDEFIIIGLTGRTGSGCSTVADLLKSKSFQIFVSDQKTELTPSNKPTSNNELKYHICYNYLNLNWTSANVIKVTHLIILICLQDGTLKFLQHLRKWLNKMIIGEKDPIKMKKYEKNKSDILKIEQEVMPKILEKWNSSNEDNYIKSLFQRNDLYDVNNVYNELTVEQSYKSPLNNKKLEEIKEYIEYSLPQYYKIFNETIKDFDLSFIEIFQLFGNYIRHSNFFGNNKYSLPQLLNHIIQFYKYYNDKHHLPTLIVIDALRNPYEIVFLQKRYSSFYTMVISADDETRKKKLRDDKKYTDEQIREFDETEFPTKKTTLEEMYLYQNIQKCTESSDIHIVNDYNNKTELRKQLIRYVSLMKHAGLVTPTHEERIMQIAFTAKHNSGCIARQVGAVVTDGDFAIKTIGWNNVPAGQTPCLLKDCYKLLEGGDAEHIIYSQYEQERKRSDPKTPTFIEELGKKINGIGQNIFEGRNVSYCFREIYNEITGEKNQVYTRALHAEENAFLQVVRYGGQGIKGGNLFTTASPCELCAKKAYQLGVKKIYYIDLYPGITQSHILQNGKRYDIGKDNYGRPQMILFRGAVGRAYFSLYQPIIPYKDEINEILRCNQKT